MADAPGRRLHSEKVVASSGELDGTRRLSTSAQPLVHNLHGFTDGTSWARFTTAQVTGSAVCTPAEAFTGITFDDAVLVRSNLGNLGGRCYSRPDASPPMAWSELCDEECDHANGRCSSPPEIYIRNVGSAPGGIRIDLRVTNETECTSPSDDVLPTLPRSHAPTHRCLPPLTHTGSHALTCR
jgi:hypothetical protein